MKKAIRILLGALLPVMLYVFGLFLLQATKLIREDETLQWVVVFLFYGYMIMGIPSIIYSVIIETLKKKKMKLIRICSIGGALGFLSGASILLFEWELNIILSMCLPGAIIGAIIPLILHPINNQSEPDGSLDSVTRSSPH